ncbi:MAG: hypothetical protein K2W33_06770, partial [Burkholderiales bacterium]|nr:hypothetical protein [Burkholderiales bacterium]
MKPRLNLFDTRHVLAASCLALPLALWAQVPAPQLAPLPDADWQKANAAVAEFPRGHADVLKWEQQNQPAYAVKADSVDTAGAGRVAGAATPADGLSLPSAEAAVRQAWAAHRGLTRPQNRMGATNVALLAQGRWTEVDP